MAKYIYGHHSPVLSDSTNTEEIQKRLPDTRMQPYLDYAEDTRRMQKEIGILGKVHNQTGWTRGGYFKRIAAGIPAPILGAIEQVDEEFGHGTGSGRAKFYRWLQDHPEWNTTVKGKL